MTERDGLQNPSRGMAPLGERQPPLRKKPAKKVCKPIPLLGFADLLLKQINADNADQPQADPPLLLPIWREGEQMPE